MAAAPKQSWRDREAAAQPRGVPLDPSIDPIEGIQAFPSLYAPGHLLITGDPEAALAELIPAAGSFGWTIEPQTVVPDRNAKQAEEESAGFESSGVEGAADATPPRDTTLTRAVIRPLPRSARTTAVPKVDAWRLLQEARLGKDGGTPGDRSPVRRTVVPERRVVDPSDPLRAVGLDHVLTVDTAGVNRYARTNPTADRYARTNPAAGTESYAYPGSGGLEVVTFQGAAPIPLYSVQDSGRRPVVAVVDTGCGEHSWLPERVDPTVPSVWRRVPAPRGASVIGVDEPRTDPEKFGDQTGARDGMIDGSSGHGTFISGIVRQVSPDANLIAVRVADSDGTVLESELIDALEELVESMDRVDDPLILDVVNLSLGYYHETPDDGLFTTGLYDVLTDLRERGVVIVCSAGNDATDRPAFPAALWDWGDADLGIVDGAGLAAHISVGALNPTGRSVALYSNIGDWVRVYAPGTSVLSTTPAFEGGVQSGARDDLYGLARMTIDPDDFRGGFAIWSGTSFAAPHVAGLIAQAMAKQLTSTGIRPPDVADQLLARLGADQAFVAAEPDAASEGAVIDPAIDLEKLRAGIHRGPFPKSING